MCVTTSLKILSRTNRSCLHNEMPSLLIQAGYECGDIAPPPKEKQQKLIKM